MGFLHIVLLTIMARCQIYLLTVSATFAMQMYVYLYLSM